MLLLFLVACGGTATPTTSTTTRPVTTTTATGAGGSTTTTTRPAEQTSTTFGGGTTPSSTPPSSNPPANLVAVRVAGQEGFDRVVFEFDSTVPAYRILYNEGPFTGTAGLPVPVEGAAVLRVSLAPARAADSYKGPKTVKGGTSNVTEALMVEDFEAVVLWGVGVRRMTAFRVDTLTSPPRIVLDVLTEG